MSFEKVLVANRGEIACRVLESARSLGYRTVAVFSEADAGARHVQLADEAVCIGPATAAESYLNVAALLDACRRSGADAVHPSPSLAFGLRRAFGRRVRAKELWLPLQILE